MTQTVQQHPSGGYIFEELYVGMTAEKAVEVTEARIQQFAEASDDFNPVHMDEAFASKTAYRGRIAHGLLSASFGSAVVGMIRATDRPPKAAEMSSAATPAAMEMMTASGARASLTWAAASRQS